MEAGLAGRASIPFRAIATGQIRGRRPWAAAANLARMAHGVAQCGTIMAEFAPDVVFITGGYVAAPVAWAAWRRRIPLLVYLPDIEPGLAIRLTSRLATRVAVSFPEVTRYFGDKAVVTGYPVRSELLTADRPAARRALGLIDDAPALLVFGGSRGAASINRALTAVLPALLPHCQIIHITGELDWPHVAAHAQNPAHATRYHAHPYLHDEMPLALAAADLVVARAGASTLGEFPALGLPSILVPYPHAGQHQAVNAAYLAERGAAQVLRDVDLARLLASSVIELLQTPAKLAAMATASARLARPDAAAAIADELERLARRVV